jgi:hypothetical protein
MSWKFSEFVAKNVMKEFLGSIHFGSGSGRWKSWAYFWYYSEADIKLRYSALNNDR